MNGKKKWEREAEVSYVWDSVLSFHSEITICMLNLISQISPTVMSTLITIT